MDKGWYQDPTDTQMVRYWNGREWTDMRRPPHGGESPPAPPPQQQMSPDGMWRWDGARWLPATAPSATKKNPVFLWVFLAIQALFVWWMFSSVSAADCANSEYVAACETGTGMGLFFIILFWAAADVILGVGYAVYKVASR